MYTIPMIDLASIAIDPVWVEAWGRHLRKLLGDQGDELLPILQESAVAEATGELLLTATDRGNLIGTMRVPASCWLLVDEGAS